MVSRPTASTRPTRRWRAAKPLSPRDERIDFVSIVTPNHLHFPVAKAFIERGFHVVCDKPLTTTLEDAEELCRLVKKHDVVFALTHPYGRTRW